MKKLFVAATLGLALVSCGGEDEKTENSAPTVCDCVKWEEEAGKEMNEAKDEAAKKAVEDKWKDKEETCKKLADGKTDEEKKAMMEEAENCK
jgi:basic membrane lipoprotein Med (substrate-binding protein (PBP1-ABC) superfamily)